MDGYDGCRNPSWTGGRKKDVRDLAFRFFKFKLGNSINNSLQELRKLLYIKTFKVLVCNYEYF
jgi:hypothetical protein